MSTCLPQHPAVDRHQQTALLGGGNKLCCVQHSALRVTPPNECLDARDAASFDFDLRLIFEEELPALESLPKFGVEGC